MILKAVVADDEDLARDELDFLLQEHPEVEVVGHASNGLEAVERIRELQPDLVFLDIQMPGLHGFGVVAQLSRLSNPPAVIFVTAFDRYAIDAFKVNAIDYLLKPIDKDRLTESIRRAQERIRSGKSERILDETVKLVGRLQSPDGSRNRVAVRHRGRYHLIDSRSLAFARMQHGMIELVAQGLRGTTNVRSLDELETLLGSPSFFRTHRTYLVNLDHVEEVIPWFSGRLKLKMNDDGHSEIPVSRARAKVLKKLLKM